MWCHGVPVPTSSLDLSLGKMGLDVAASEAQLTEYAAISLEHDRRSFPIKLHCRPGHRSRPRPAGRRHDLRPRDGRDRRPPHPCRGPSSLPFSTGFPDDVGRAEPRKRAGNATRPRDMDKAALVDLVWQKNRHERRFSGVIAPTLVYGSQLVT
jgi:hypothetical protein